MNNIANEHTSHSIYSTLRERTIEHVFLGKALQWLWQHKVWDMEVLRSEFDAGGYDLVMSRGSIVKHIQLKTTLVNGKTANIKASLKLMGKPSGCIIWIFVNSKLEIDHCRLLRNIPGKPLFDNEAKHTKGNAQGKKLKGRYTGLSVKGNSNRAVRSKKLWSAYSGHLNEPFLPPGRFARNSTSATQNFD
jgi:hypothetical protein